MTQDSSPQMPRQSLTPTESRASRLEPGTEFGRYHIIRRLGEGAMGSVFLAHDPALDRQIALKIPKIESGDTEARSRFLREARTAASLRHPNICPLHEVGEVGTTLFLTMAFIEGRPLSDFCNPQRPVALGQAALVVRKLALGLADAHAIGIIHRDLKPDNVMIDHKGEPILMDFGLARSFRHGDGGRVTQAGLIMGSPAYMSPEQIRDDAALLGPATDIYSLGVILFELVTGRLPFEGSVGVVMSKSLNEAPPTLRDLRPDADERLELVCLRMIEKNPADRFPSMQKVADALKAYLAEDRRKDSEIQPRISIETIPQRQVPSARKTMRESAFRGTALTVSPKATLSANPTRQHTFRQFLPQGFGIGVAVVGVLGTIAVALSLVDRRAQLPSPTRPSQTGQNPAASVATESSRAAPDVAAPRPENTPEGGNRTRPATDPAGGGSGELEWAGNRLKMKFCWCPDGTFTMGSPAGEKDRDTDEGQVQVTLTGFWMGKFEVTQSEWKNVMGTTVQDQQAKSNNPALPVTGPQHPMYFVNFDEATDFARKFTQQERIAGRLTPGWEYRLPTEAQWEYACRAGTETRFACGDDESSLDRFAWFSMNARTTTHPVGEKLANPWGLHDMHGNVNEICRDCYAQKLPGGRDPEVTGRSSQRMVRGGGFDYGSARQRSAFRYKYVPVYRHNFLGFRLAAVRITAPDATIPKPAIPAR